MQMQEGSLQIQLLFRLVHFKLHLRKSAVPDYLRGPILKMTVFIIFQAEQALCQHTDPVSISSNNGHWSCYGLCLNFRKFHDFTSLFKKCPP